MIRFPRLLPLALGTVVLAGLPMLAACSGSGDDGDSGSSSSRSKDSKTSNSTVKVDKWTAGMCDAVTTWLDEVGTLSALVDLDSQTAPAQVKASMVDYLTDLDDRTKEFKSDIDDLGNPDLKDGKKIQAALAGAAGDVVKIFEDALKEVKTMDSSNATALASQLTALGDTLTKAGDKVGDAFTAIDEDYDTTKISEAAEDLPECKGIFS